MKIKYGDDKPMYSHCEANADISHTVYIWISIVTFPCPVKQMVYFPIFFPQDG